MTFYQSEQLGRLGLGQGMSYSEDILPWSESTDPVFDIYTRD